jgi:hypothetical protein
MGRELALIDTPILKGALDDSVVTWTYQSVVAVGAGRYPRTRDDARVTKAEHGGVG